MVTRIKLKRGTAEEWEDAKPVLFLGEPGYETDTGLFKMGDGETEWLDLPAFYSTELLEDVFESYAYGVEAGYAEITTTYTTTSTDAGSTTHIPSLSVSVLGNGRPVDIEFYAPTVYHSVANTLVGAILLVDDSPLNADANLCAATSPSTTSGPSMILKNRVVIADGVTKVFEVVIWGAAAGTCTLSAGGFAPIMLSAVRR